MNILFLVLNETEYLDEILDGFVEVGVKGATILDSQGMGSALLNGGKDIPFFGVLRNLRDDARPYNKTIFTVIEDDEILDKAVNIVKEVLGDMEKPGVGLMFTLPVGKIYGMRD
ncbi:hypothetical protein KQI41_14050 [Tissierella pigra]|uniref:Nitrogen regulatory protein P-II n=1 Tax=Tissierella pigra TaxID=2607614 RepID=A0A6N7XWS8_9FIRM|nr:hypothetical protein [Tissierella pigra]MBU5427511.1 hypothetical protein [Tissierella pigra]MSU00260.1 hypothetical protein [Tissierella pigra]